MDAFEDRLGDVFTAFGRGRTAVLSTSEGGRVSSRMMSVVLIDGEFYFQTDCTMRKYRQLCADPNAALCADNIQIEGTCRELGHPAGHPEFCEAFKSSFRGSFDAYTNLSNERLFTLTPVYIKRWLYTDGKPYTETFDIPGRVYELKAYISE